MKLKEFLKESEQIGEDILTEAAASKSRVKKMEKLSDKIVKDMYKLIELFSKEHIVSSGDATLYKTKKDWEQLTRDVDRAYGGWFGFVYDSDYIENK
jgi:t-SNARE complex subunit (syntaxin)